MDTIEPKLLKGFRDYLPEQMIPRQRMIDTIARVFERFGFAPIHTPALEYAEVLLGKLGEDAENLFYRFTDHGGRDICLRYDLTVPLARVAAQYRHLRMPFKRYQIAPVWRAEKPGKGRFREFYQCDVDIVGTDSLLADAECIAVDHAVLTALGIPDAVIRINNRKVLAGLLDALELGGDGAANAQDILRTIDKLPSHGEKTVRALLAEKNGLAPDRIDRVFEFIRIEGEPEAMIEQAEPLIGGSQAGADGLDELRQVIEFARHMGVPALELDFTIARGLDYYTGTVFETFLPQLPDLGSVMSGGRYDHLISGFLGRDVPAVGISVGIDRLFSGMESLGLVEQAKTPTRVLVAPMGPETVDAALRAAHRLRSADIPTEVYLKEARLGKQLKHADQQGIGLVVILGTEEVAAETATVKEMESGDQTEVPLAQLADHVRARLG